MTKTETVFNEVKDDYAKEYLRTNGKEVEQLEFRKGYVVVNGSSVRISKFKEMIETLKNRPSKI
jgi:riboflavin synthase alpha subunit